MKLQVLVSQVVSMVLFATSVNALTLESEQGKFQITVPEVVSRTEEFEVKIRAKPMDADYILVRGGCWFIQGQIRDEDKSLISGRENQFYTKYDGEKELTIAIVPVPFFRRDDRHCEMGFVKSPEALGNVWERKNSADAVEWNFNVARVNPIANLPKSNFNREWGAWKSVAHISLETIADPSRETQYPQDIPFYQISIISGISYPKTINGIDTDYRNPDYEGLVKELDIFGKSDTVWNVTETQNRKTVYGWGEGYYDENGYDDRGKRASICHRLLAYRFYPHFYIKIEIEKRISTSLGQGPSASESAKEELLSFIKGFRLSQAGFENTSDAFVDEEEIKRCEIDSDCGDSGLVCTACNECKKEAINPTEVEVSIALSNKFSSASIPNSIRKRTLLTTSINPEFNHNGQNIDYCEIAAPGIKKELEVKMKNADSYAGFTVLGRVIEERTIDQKREIDFTKQPLEYQFYISPKDRKKEVGVVGEITEIIESKVEDLATTEEELVLTPVDFSIDFKSNGIQLQHSSNKMVRATVNNNIASNIFLKASLLGPGKIQLGAYKLRTDFVSTQPGVTEKIMYYSPALGNFDIGSELSSLSMSDLQKAAGKQIIEDAVLAYAGDYFQGVGDAYIKGNLPALEAAGITSVKNYLRNNPDKSYALKALVTLGPVDQQAKFADLVAKGYSLSAGTYGLTLVPGGITGMSEDMVDATSMKTLPDKKTWTESVVEYGVVGIDLAQTAVGILTFVPSKIPVVKDVTALGKTAFSAMTNIWKANFKYIARDEKIARAEEKFIPVGILLTAEDESGWQLKQVYILQVAYHEI